MKKTLLLLFMSLLCVATFAQTTLSGKVTDQTGEPIPLANIKLRGNSVGAVTDFDGEFVLATKEPLPLTITASSIGYESVSLEVTSSDEEITIVLQEGTELDVVIVSASRAPERIFESPVRVEYYGSRQIKNTPAIDFYSGLENIKGVDVNSTGLTFKTVNTRGFGGYSNPRFVQLIDGVDNTAPALGFYLGNLVGVSELDVKSVELLPGASSALYGANAFNGLLTINTKSPFTYQGISAYSRGGATSQDAAGTNSFYDVGVRVAKAFSNKLAGKADVSYFKGTEWFADDLRNQGIGADPNLTRSNPGYNGINVYGDEVNAPLTLSGEANPVVVSRTGYRERELVDYNAESLKFSGALHYKPFADDLEVILQTRFGTGTTIFQNANRFYSPNFFLQQHKLEVKNNNFFVRGYISIQDTGDTYDTRVAATNIENRWKSNVDWFTEYATRYEQTFAGVVPGQDPSTAGNTQLAHDAARDFAGRLDPDSVEFQELFDRVVNDTDFTTGAKFKDESSLVHADANYNFSYLTNGFMDIQVGGSYREYRLKSFGTIFTDEFSPIAYNEVGVYTQIQKKFVDDRLKVTSSVRYDKAELFDGYFSPRLALGITLGEDRNHNIRVSYQTGFRNPTTQNLYMGLDLGPIITMGTARDNLDRETRTLPISQNGQTFFGQPSTVTITGNDAFTNSYTLESAFAAQTTMDPTLLRKAAPELVKPETVKSIEAGYRGDFGKISVEFSGYYSQFNDFIAAENVAIPLYGSASDFGQDPNNPPSQQEQLAVAALSNGDVQFYNLANNVDEDVSSFGFVYGVDGKIFQNFDISVSHTYAKSTVEGLDSEEANEASRFNTPEHKAKLTFGNRNLFKNFGFNSSLKWSSSFFWNDAFGRAEVPSYTVIDAQVNYKIPKAKAVIKVGATNIGGPDYLVGIGAGAIGSQYYLSLVLNNL